MADAMIYHVASGVRLHAADGASANDWRVGSSQVLSVASATTATVTNLANEFMCYVSTDQPLMLRFDGVAATATSGITVPFDSTSVFYCRESVANAVQIYNKGAVAANIYVQFLKRV